MYEGAHEGPFFVAARTHPARPAHLVTLIFLRGIYPQALRYIACVCVPARLIQVQAESQKFISFCLQSVFDSGQMQAELDAECLQ